MPRFNVALEVRHVRGRRAATAVAACALLALGAALGGCSASPTDPSGHGLRVGHPLLQQGSPADTAHGRDTTGGATTQGNYQSPAV